MRDILEHARSLPARDAAAAVTGAVRVHADDLSEDQARTMLDAALAWGHKDPAKQPWNGCSPVARTN